MLSFSRFPCLVAFLFLLAGPLPAQIGELDPSFAPPALLNGAAAGSIRALAHQSTGQLVIAGTFTMVGGTARGNIARLHADGSLDPTFAPGAGANGPIHAMLAVGNGNFLIGGDFTEVDGVSRNRIALLTSTGTLDPALNPGTGFDGPVYALLVSNGLLVGGDFTSFNGVARSRIARLTSVFGGLESTTFGGGANGPVHALAFDQSRREIFVGGAFTSFAGAPRNGLAKVSSFDFLLDSLVFTTGADGPVYALLLRNVPSVPLPQLFVGGDFNLVEGIARKRFASCSGRFSSPFDPAVQASPNFSFNGTCRKFHLPAAGTHFYAAGDFTTVSDNPRGRLARFTRISDRFELDVTFGNSPGADGPIYAVTTTVDGKAYIGGTFAHVDGTARPGIARLYGSAGSQPPATPASFTATALSSHQVHVKWNAVDHLTTYTLEQSPDGTNGWSAVTTLTPTSTAFIVSNLNAGATYYFRVRADNSNGASAPSTVASATTAANPWTGSGALLPTQFSTNGEIQAISQLGDGRILVAGNFTTFMGQPRNRIARLMPDYSLDTTFDPGVGANNSILAIAPMPDGRVYVQGHFESVGETIRLGLARLNSDGSLDTSFDPGSAGGSSYSVYSIALQPDGKLLVGGSFDNWSGPAFGGVDQEYLVRLNMDGTVDRGFRPIINSSLTHVAIQPDGRILISGYFAQINGVARNRLARLTPNGELDETFATGFFDLSRISALMNGSVLVSGSFTTIENQPRQRVAILTPTGVVDASFVTSNGPDATVNFAAEQPDGKILILGAFEKIGTDTRWKIGRLNRNGSNDPTFNAEVGPGLGTVRTATSLMDGSILVSGLFATSGTNVVESYLVRLRGDAITQLPSAVSAPTLEALSSSSVHLRWNDSIGEFAWIVQKSLDGTNWSNVIELPWTTRSFIVSGLNPGINYFFRVTPRNAAGGGVPSPSATESTFTAYKQWKLDEGFSATEPQTADHDGDDIPLLMEYALGLDPRSTDLEGLPVTQLISDTLALSYRKFRSDVLYSVETSTDLVEWNTNGVNQGSGPFPIAWTPRGSAEQKFLRLKVSAAE